MTNQQTATPGPLTEQLAALAPFAAAAKHMTVGKKVDPQDSGIWTAPDGSCRLTVADFQKAAAVFQRAQPDHKPQA